ncbi:hypothetical protein H0H87_005491 [Tephrocybe sp. NHM501043]|nr:hypothetical protein H0H87_005491 [Tephrocybe sp. NHM501043]
MDSSLFLEFNTRTKDSQPSYSRWPQLSADSCTSSSLDLELLSRIRSVVHDLEQYKKLLECRGSNAQKILDTLQNLLDRDDLDAQLRRSLVVAVQRLSEKSKLYPTCFELHHIIRDNQYPEVAGGFADIFKGKFEGQSVSLKAFRIYRSTEIEHFLKQVCREAILWGQLSHPNILPLYGLYRFGAQICLVSPWMEAGSVSQFLKSNPDAPCVQLVKINACINDGWEVD